GWPTATVTTSPTTCPQFSAGRRAASSSSPRSTQARFRQSKQLHRTEEPVRILIGYDGSQSADAAIATAGKLLAGSDVEAIVLSVWEPVSVATVRADRFGGSMVPFASDASEVDDRSEQQARNRAEHGARLADAAG